MKISAIIPTFNRAYILDRAIQSVLNQECPCFEIIVVDDGSTDDTDKLMEKFPEVKYIKSENRGVSAARNLGASHATGDFLAFLDSDDEWLPNKIKLQSEYLNEFPDTPLIHGEELWIRNGKRVNLKKIHKKTGGDIYSRCLNLCLISPSTTIIKKDIFNELGGFDEEFTVCEDYDLWLKLTSKYSVAFIDTPISKKYGGHEDQLSMKYFAMDYYRIKAMYNILNTRELPKDKYADTISVIIKKSEILIKGYIKHNNLKDLKEIEAILKWCTERH